MTSFRNVFLDQGSLGQISAPKEPKLLLEQEYAPVYTAWKQEPSDRNTDALLSSIKPLIDYHVNTVGNADKGYLTLQGKILAMRSMPTYDPSRSSLSTYLGGQLLPLRRFARQQMNILNVPERQMLASQQLEGAEVELEDRLGRSPTTDELSDHTGMSSKQIERIRRFGHAKNTGSYDTPTEEGGIMSPAVRRKLPTAYLHDYVLSAFDSDPVSRFIYENDNDLLGRQKLSNQELAAKLRISTGAVSQRRKKILEITNKAQEAIYA